MAVIVEGVAAVFFTVNFTPACAFSWWPFTIESFLNYKFENREQICHPGSRRKSGWIWPILCVFCVKCEIVLSLVPLFWEIEFYFSKISFGNSQLVQSGLKNYIGNFPRYFYDVSSSTSCRGVNSVWPCWVETGYQIGDYFVLQDFTKLEWFLCPLVQFQLQLICWLPVGRYLNPFSGFILHCVRR
jgi:hypothetical protein